MTHAMIDLFNTGKMLKEITNTILTLIPKVKCPSSITEFRPIACCNVIYKATTKILFSRMRSVLPVLIS